MPNALPNASVERFLDDLSRFGAVDDLKFGLCVSGGADSLALLLLAHQANIDCEVATVDHKLRPEAAKEAEHVAQICDELGLRHDILTLTEKREGNVSDWARQARYAALGEWAIARKIDLLVTAHHADDQLETMIMRLNRGSGIAGLAGVRELRGHVIRPLLGWRKRELEDIVKTAGIAAVDDPTNRDDRFDRARLRKSLADADWLDPVAASRTAAALAEAEDALDWTARAYENRRVAEQSGIISFDPRNLPKELIRRITLACLRRISPQAAPRGSELDRLIHGLESNRVASLAGVKCSGGVFWLFEKAPARARN